jgi:hypothetical protein
MLMIRIGVCVIRESASDERRIWPPPSPIDPSITSM